MPSLPHPPHATPREQTLIPTPHPLAERPTTPPPRPVTLALLTDAPDYAPDAALWHEVAFQAVLHPESEQALLELLESTPVDFVLLDPAFGRAKFLDNIKRARPATRLLFLVEEPRPTRLMKLRARGHEFLSLPRQERTQRLAQQLLELLFPRAEPRQKVHGITLSFAIDEANRQRLEYPLADISPHGLAWNTDIRGLHEALLPGAMIHHLKAHRADETLFSADRASIRHLTATPPEERGPNQFRIGVRLLADEARPTGRVEEKLFHDPITVASLLKQALEHDALEFTLSYGAATIHPGRWEMARDTTSDAHHFTGEWPEEWRAGTILRGHFELNNWGCEFLAMIEGRIDERTIRLQSPATIRGVKRREIPRHQPSERAGITIRFQLPFAERAVEVEPRDFSVHGFGFELTEREGPVIPGTQLRSITVRGIGSPFTRYRGVVRYARVVYQRGERYYRCGVSLKGVNGGQGYRMADTLVTDQLPDVKSGQGMRLEDLWSFFYASNFIYPKKEEAMRPILNQVQNTFTTLLRDPDSPILRTIVVESDENTVTAHMSLLRAYSNTWIMQHLASVGMQKGNRNAAKDINIGTVDTLSQFGDARWMRAYFQPSKSFPDKIAGVFARRVEDHKQSNLNIYSYLSSPTSLANESSIPLSVSPANKGDLNLLESYFIAEDSLLEFLAEDGQCDEMGLESIGRQYDRYGLHRRRRFIVAELNGRVCGIASLEFSSFGLNLSEVTNRCTIHVWEHEPFAIISLAEYARCLNRSQGIPFCIVLVKPEHAPTLIARGFNHSRDYACWTLHRDLFPEYADYIEKAFSTRA